MKRHDHYLPPPSPMELTIIVVLLSICLLMLLTGCAFQHTASVNPETKQVQTFTQVVWFQKANVEGLKAHSKTAAFSVSKESTETQTEALAAVVQAAVQGAVKGAK